MDATEVNEVPARRWGYCFSADAIDACEKSETGIVQIECSYTQYTSIRHYLNRHELTDRFAVYRRGQYTYVKRLDGEADGQ